MRFEIWSTPPALRATPSSHASHEGELDTPLMRGGSRLWWYLLGGVDDSIGHPTSEINNQQGKSETKTPSPCFMFQENVWLVMLLNPHLLDKYIFPSVPKTPQIPLLL